MTPRQASFAELNDPVRHELRNLESRIQSGELSEVAQGLNALRARYPTDWRIYGLAVQLAEAAGNTVAAKDAARRAYELAPEAATAAIIEWARVLSRDGEHEKALREAKRAVAQCPGDDEFVLTRAVHIAEAGSDWEFARECLLKALSAVSEERGVTVMRALGYNALKRSQHTEAESWFDKVLKLYPDDETALWGRAQARMLDGKNSAAAEDVQALCERFPKQSLYAYYLAYLRGGTPESQPDTVTLGIVEGYAPHFDQHVVGGLGYYAPRKAAELIVAAWPDHRPSVLDLGCGTGLLGLYLGEHHKGLVGVDFSKTMLEQAAQRGYDRLHYCDLREALRDTADETFDCIVACDVFIYVGALTPHLGNIARILKPEGMCILTFEDLADAEFKLMPSHRFAHSQSHVSKQLEAAGLADVRIESITLRNEGGQPIPGFIATARKRVIA